MKPPLKPNFLFLFPDQHRPDWLGCDPGLPLRTPNLDRLAQKGVRFTHAYTPSPLCSPARACLATGHDYEHCQVPGNGNNTPTSLPTYYRNLRDAGYEVVGVGKFDLHKAEMNWGLDGSNRLAEYGFTGGIDNEGKGDAITSCLKNSNRPKGPYMNFLHERGLLETHLAMYKPHMGKPHWLNFPAVTDLPDDAYCDNWVAANGMTFLRGFPKDKPWHLVVNFTGPHGPFDVTRSMRERWSGVDIPPPHDSKDTDIKTVLERRQNYAAMIENIDRHVGEMIRLVEQRGELDRTIIIYSSDHGEMLGDHDVWGKTVWHTPSAGIPLIMAGPGIQSGKVSSALVALHDLAPTFLDYAAARPLEGVDGRTLRPLLEGRQSAHRECLFSGLQAWRMAFDGRFKLVLGAKISPLLYDLQEDPFECKNIADSAPDVVQRLSQLIPKL